ncbi:DNA recombination protein RmuC [Dongia sedimenti]|uniref:DNA recombination protein RmuC homolog n=1 Tax=Dongia sedimenti TaxID=3064282 RepID=A0ABU0YSC6_9PROT|nr:DNA recombination protein RmuC [Rhodospirillaceae bacterium R-7]
MSEMPIILSALALLGVLAILILQLRPKEVVRPDPRLDALSGQLQQLAAHQAGSQEAMDRRLSELGNRVADRLQMSATEAGKSLTELKERLAVIDAAQKNIAELSGQMVGLQDILSNKQSRGAFGEIQLADLVRDVMPAANYEFQAAVGNGRRVDCLLKLPNPPGSIGIDAKFPLEAYRSLREAKDDIATKLAQREFTTAIRTHVKAIAEKYIVPGVTADSALMFLPSEAVYAELHSNFPNLVDEACRAKVWIVSPTTMMATLTTIRAVLRDVSMREQAHVIQAKVRELLKDIERLDERVDKLQTHFGQVNEDVRQIRISTDKVTKRAEQIESVELEDERVTQLPLPERIPG